MVKAALAGVALIVMMFDVAQAQPNVTFDSPFLVRAANGVKKRDTINILNSGAAGTTARCALVYGFDATGQMLNCCGCLVPLNVLASLSVGTDILAGGKPPKAMSFMVLGASPVANTCDAAAPGALSSGLVVTKGEAPFSPATLSAGQLSNLTLRCSILHATPNRCPSCPAGP